MLWSCNDDFVGVTIANGEHPGATALAKDCSCQAMETAVGHSFLDTGVTDNVYPVANLKSLDNAGARWQPPLS